MMEDDEDVLIFKDDKESEFFNFLKQMIVEHASAELKIPENIDMDNDHETTYGFCKKPFGMVRIRVVEFLAEAYKVFYKDLH